MAVKAQAPHHVVAALQALDQGAALGALLPLVLLGQLQHARVARLVRARGRRGAVRVRVRLLPALPAQLPVPT